MQYKGQLFIIGDYYSGTGPANVTKELIRHYKGRRFIQRFRNKFLRLIELFVKVPFSDICLISGYSLQNLWCIRLAAFWKKRTIYLMHGCVEFENIINHEVSDEMTACERSTLDGCDMILAVSESFRKWLCGFYPEYKDKFVLLRNGVTWDDMLSNVSCPISEKSENVYTVISVGGGMIRKRIAVICEAVKILNYMNIPVRLFVAGAVGEDTDKIRACEYAEDLGLLKKEELFEKYSQSDLFIQNSSFETFGLAPLEALVHGCSLLLSEKVGALEVFDQDSLSGTDVVCDGDNPQELCDKIKYLIKNPNHDRLLKALDRRETSWEAVCLKLTEILIKMKK